LSPAEWDLLVQEAQAEGVAPLLYRALSRSGGIACLPKPVAARLRAMYFGTRMNNQQVLRELERLAGRLDQAGIPVVALKGACFALTIYPDIGLRPMVDLDLLVPVSRASAALQIARGSGYVEALPEASPGLDGLLNHAVCLRKTALPYTTLELHTTLVAEGSFTHAVPVDWFWSQTEPLPGMHPDRKINNLLMLTPTAQVLYACAHAMLQHGGRNTSLRWLYDLDRLIRVYAERERLDWDLLLSQARRFEWGSAASAALSEVVDTFDTPVPQKVLDDLSRHADRNTERVAALQKPPATHTLEEYQKWKALSWRGRIRLVLALIAPSPAYMRWRYGLRSAWALPAYYLYRWWGIFKDAIRTVIRLRQAGYHRSHRTFPS
jgi:hypothetical protein